MFVQSPLVIILMTVNVLFVGRMMRVGVKPNFSDNAPFVQTDKAMTHTLRNFHRVAFLQNAHFGRMLIGCTQINSRFAADDAPKFAAAVMVLPRETLPRRDEENFWTTFTLLRLWRNLHPRKVGGDEFVSLRIHNSQECAPRPRRIYFGDGEGIVDELAADGFDEFLFTNH